MTDPLNSEATENLLKHAMQAILKNSVDYIFIKDKDIICRAASDSFLKLMGCTGDQLYGHSDEELFDRELADHYRSDDLEVIRDGRTIIGEVENAKPEGGKERWGHTHKFPVRDESGTIIGLVGISTDFTVQHDLQLQAQKARQTWDLLNNIPVGCGLCHFENGFFCTDMTNDGLYLIPFISPDTVNAAHGKRFVEAVCEADRQAVIDEYERVRELPGETGSVDFRIRGRDDNLHWIKFKFRRAYLHDGVQYYYVAYGDIDQQKRAELEMIRTQQMYNSAALEARMILATCDIKKRQMAMMQTGYTARICQALDLPAVIENVPQSLLSFIDKRDHKAFLDAFRQVDEGAARGECEFRLLLPGQGMPRYERLTLQRICDKKGRLLTVHSCSLDITEQKLAQAEYNRLREQICGNLVGVVGSFQLNLSKNLYISGYSPWPKVVEALKRDTADEHFAATAETVIDEQIRLRILGEYNCSHLLKLYESGQRCLECDYPVITSHGGTMWIHSTLYLMRNPDSGEIEGITYSKDVTRQLLNERIISHIVQEDCDFIAVLDTADGSIELHSGRWPCEEFPEGRKFAYDNVKDKFLPASARPDQNVPFGEAAKIENVCRALHLKSKYKLLYQCPNPAHSGGMLDKQVCFSWLNEEKREILVIQRDITDLSRRERQQIAALEKAKLEAERANEAKSVFLSNMSHDLRTPLNGVLGFTTAALEENDPAKVKAYLQKIDFAGKLLLDLVNDTLDLSRIESGKYSLELEPVDLGHLAEEIISALRPSAEMKGVQMISDLSKLPDELVLMDRLKTQKVILNLLSNAVKFTPAGGTVYLSIAKLPPAENGLSHRIIVEDTGIGIGQEFLPMLFEPFSQEHRRESAQTAGTGLGLSIVKRIVELAGGTIQVQSKINAGTRFTVDISLKATVGFSPEKTEEISDQSLHGRVVLLCEDNPLNSEIASIILREHGVIVDCATDGREGLTMFSDSMECYYDAILMDLRMPEMDGCSATRAIRALKRADALVVPIIALTADVFAESAHMAREAGMNDYITKPFSPQKMLSTLLKNLRRN